MSQLLSTCLLFQDGSSSPELKKTEVNLHPGVGFSPDQGNSILLAGGFTSISPESGFPLSPTLQLNFDMTSASSEDLEDIALTELERYNSINYRSYAVDANKRVCVVSSDINRLQRFIDTYGGLLEIAPLLTKGYSTEVPTALDLKISKGKNGSRLEYQVQSPINFEVCTYCGECGPSCPENCLSENLYIDFAKCTFCKECEKVCEAGAIDVHSAVIEILDIPAVIVLGEQEIEGKIFTEQEIPQYLATLFPCQIDEVVSCDNSICQFSSRLGYGCKICQQICQYGAISLEKDGVHVDALKCEECGACVSACPTGSLQNERFNDETFFNYCSKINLPSDGTVVLGNEKSLHKLWWNQKKSTIDNCFFLQYENVESLSLFHFAFLLDSGVRRIIVLNDEPNEGLELKRQIDLTKKITTGLFGIADAILQSSAEDFLSVVQTEVSGSFGVNTDRSFEFLNRRQQLGKALEGLMLRSGQEMRLPVEEAGPISFARVICDSEKCTHCMACLNDCQINALIADKDQLALNHLGIMCVGCGICVRVCPEDALSLSPDVSITSSFFTPLKLAEAEPMKCKKCDKVFGTKKSFDRVMEILQNKETVDTSHFEYCETCRVVNLFEAE